jgi:hypothetical protein
MLKAIWSVGENNHIAGIAVAYDALETDKIKESKKWGNYPSTKWNEQSKTHKLDDVRMFQNSKRNVSKQHSEVFCGNEVLGACLQDLTFVQQNVLPWDLQTNLQVCVCMWCAGVQVW